MIWPVFRFLGRNLENIFSFFFGTFKTSQFYSEINWPVQTLHTCLELLDQGYEDKVKRILAKHEIILTRLNDKELQIIIEKTKQKIEKARNPGVFSRKKDKPDEPEAKKRREDMTEDGKREFDSWLDEVKAKRQEMLDKRSARHVRKQQLSKR